MATIITMPRLSDTMTEGTVANWLKKVGDKVNEGDILAEIETDKATMEFESFNEGVLLHIGIAAGETAPIDSLLAIIGNKDEDISTLLNAPTEKSTTQKEQESNFLIENSSSSTSSKSLELPTGVVIITMPRLSDTMTEGTVAKWLKKVGDKVNEGDILAEIETDKATMEFESFNEGTLLSIGIQEGSTAPIDSLLAIIGPEGTDVSNIADNLNTEIKQTITTNKEEEKTNQNKTNNTAIQNTSFENKRMLASPLAKKIAIEKGIQLNLLKGSGENGRIVKNDVENFDTSLIQTNKKEISIFNQSIKDTDTNLIERYFDSTQKTLTEEIKNSQMRKVIAKRLTESLFTAPHYNLVIEVNMENAIKSRTIINNIPNTKVSFNDMIIKAVAMSLKTHPKINSQWREDAIIINHEINIGVAVAVEDGLVVPVLKSTNNMSLSQIGSFVRDLATKAKNKKLQPSEMEGSTFTISNLGMFGITEFNSIINQPNSAILSVGAIIEKPVVKNGEIVIGNTMILSLACDHRTIDGATGAQFLQTLKQFIENPIIMLS